MHYIVIGKDPEGNVFVDANKDEKSQRELYDMLSMVSGWNLYLYSYAGEWNAALQSDIRTALMTKDAHMQMQLAMMGIQPIYEEKGLTRV